MYLSSCRWLVSALALLIVSCAPINQTAMHEASAPAKPPDVSITILVLNGTNGMPVFRESPNIWVDGADHINPKTDLFGKTRITVPSNANQIMISPNWGHECRGGDNPQAITNDHYSIAEVLSTGVVTLNLCGKFTRKPEPGVLIFYEKPSSFKELWNN